MAMYIMNSKVFFERYLKEEDIKTLNKTQFVIVSSRIRVSNQQKKKYSCIVKASELFPSNSIITDFGGSDDDYKNSSGYEEAYFDQIDDRKALLATLIQFAVENDQNVIFLCTHNERKYYYLPLLKKYIAEVFEYPVYDYKKFIDKKEKKIKYDKKDVLKICKKIQSKAKKEHLEKQLSTEKGVKDYLKSLSKDELKKELKKRDLYTKGMSKSEMIDTIEVMGW